MIPRFGQSPDARRRYRLRPGAYAILPRNGALLLTLQASPLPEVQLPGGGIDPGEAPIRALHREVIEETGWRIAAPRRLGAFRRFVFMPGYNVWAEKLYTIYAAHPVAPIADIKEPDHSAVWLPPEEAVHALANPGDRDMLGRYFSI